MTTLASAMSAFVKHPYCDRSKMDVNAWALTYGAGPETVRAEWEAAMTRHSQQQHNNCEEQA